MADKIKFDVNRSMLGDKEYTRGDTRTMSEADAVDLLASGALSRPGEKPVEREPAVKHTFGQAPAEDGNGYVSAATGEEVVPSITLTRVVHADAKPAAKRKS